MKKTRFTETQIVKAIVRERKTKRFYLVPFNPEVKGKRRRTNAENSYANNYQYLQFTGLLIVGNCSLRITPGQQQARKQGAEWEESARRYDVRKTLFSADVSITLSKIELIISSRQVLK